MITNKIKVGISSVGKDMDSQVSDVFGRCAYFIIAEIEDKKAQKVEAIENTSSGQVGGAGVSTAKTVAEKEVNAVITGNMGPRALDVLKQFNIKMYKGSGLVKDVLQEFIDGKLEEIQ